MTFACLPLNLHSLRDADLILMLCKPRTPTESAKALNREHAVLCSNVVGFLFKSIVLHLCLTNLYSTYIHATPFVVYRHVDTILIQIITHRISPMQAWENEVSMMG